MPNVAQLLKEHVTLSTRCIDRLYINGYMPKLQTSGQLCYFLRDHLGFPIPSPAILRPRLARFVEGVKGFAEDRKIPIVQFKRGQRKDDIAREYRKGFEEKEGVVFIGVAQEKARSFKARRRSGHSGGVIFDWSRQPVWVNHYYFYVQDRAWGPAFIKVCSYLPYPVKLCLNGHEWAKQCLREEGISFESLDNGILSCEHPERLQEVCDALGAADVQSFFDRWSRWLPWPLSTEDRAAGFDHKLSIWQCEVSLTQVFDRPVQGRHFFEAVIREHLDLGRPDQVKLLFPLRPSRRTPPPPRGYRTRVITRGVNTSLHLNYKRSHIKQYFKEERALRTETTINEPRDFHLNKGIENLEILRDIGDQVNRKVLEAERISQHCVLSEDTLQRLQAPTTHDNQRASALRFGDRRVMAVLHALCHFFHLPMGFRNRDLRKHVAPLLGVDVDEYRGGKMTYDLRRLRLKGIIHRIPATHRYTVTTFGLRVAFLYTKIHLRVLRQAQASMAVDSTTVPSRLRQALEKVDKEIRKLCDGAALQPAA